MSDTPSPTPRRMPWEEFETRVLEWTRKRIRARGEKPDAESKAEASALFGYQSHTMIDCLDSPPAICQRCLCLHQGREALCYKCSEAAKQEALRAEIEAQVRAELAQKGGGKC